MWNLPLLAGFVAPRSAGAWGQALFASSSSSVAPPRYEALLGWLSELSNASDDLVSIRPSSRGGGYGAFATKDVSEGDVLFEVPRRACLTVDDALEDPDCGEALKTLMEQAGPGGETVVLAGYMAKEYLLSEHQKQNDESQPSFWGPYFDILPFEASPNQDHVLFWEDEKIESLLEGSLGYEESKALKEEVDLAIRILGSGSVGKAVRVKRGEIPSDEEQPFRWPWEAKPEQPSEPPEGFAKAVTGAFVCLLTRSFQDSFRGDGDEEKLVPLLDMLQHSDTPNVRHAMRKMDGTVEVRARRDIAAGEELLNQYRSEEEESMPYWRFFTRFGFVPGIMEPIEDLLKDKSSIFYPKVVEV